MSYKGPTRATREASYRQNHGISKCHICLNCGKMYGPGHGRKFCEGCSKEVAQTTKNLNLVLFQVRTMLFASGHHDIEELKGLKKEMFEEEGPEFTDWLTGPVCKYFKKEHEGEL